MQGISPESSMSRGKELLDLVAGKVRVLFLDALNGLLKIEPFCVWPDQFALLGVELHVRQQIPENIVYLYALLALGRAHPLKESVDEGIIREDTVLRLFPALLAHEVLKQVWAVGARFVLARRRVVRDIHHAVKAPEYFVASDSRNAARLVVSGSCAQSWLTNCESMVPIG
jgi:hypothetical protein